MKISGLGSANKTTAKRSGKTQSGEGNFAGLLHVGEESGTLSAAPESPAALAGIEGILAVQSVDPEGSRRSGAGRRLLHRGEDILDRLEDVRRGLLLGHVPKDRLADLAHMIRAKRESGADARLSAILDDIELRAEIELAKLTRR